MCRGVLIQLNIMISNEAPLFHSHYVVIFGILHCFVDGADEYLQLQIWLTRQSFFLEHWLKLLLSAFVEYSNNNDGVGFSYVIASYC